MNDQKHFLNKIEIQHQQMVNRVLRWSNINSGSENISGLSDMLIELETSFSVLKGKMQRIDLPPRKLINNQGGFTEIPAGQALSIIKRPSAPIKVFLGGHMDTVFSASNPFQKAELINANVLRGPGAADMKGGLVVMLMALEVFEQTPFAEKIGWEILLNPDEEVGSVSSAPLFVESAKRNQIGLIFEPTLPDGSVVNARKGSINYTLIVKGKEAHAGRDYNSGRNAIHAIAKIISQISELNDETKGIIANVGTITGGKAANIVAGEASCLINIRMENQADLLALQSKLEYIKKMHEKDGISIAFHSSSFRPPKPFDEATQHLFETIKDCAESLGLPISWRKSGGVCDGNNLAFGLPTIDTLGVQGDLIHTDQEYLNLNSLTERAKLTTLFLMRLAEGYYEFGTQ